MGISKLISAATGAAEGIAARAAQLAITRPVASQIGVGAVAGAIDPHPFASPVDLPGVIDDAFRAVAKSSVKAVEGVPVLGRLARPVNAEIQTIVDDGVAEVSRRYIPRSALGEPVPLAQQTVHGVDLPLPDPRAAGPHTVLGGRFSRRSGETYRQSAEFPSATWPKADGHDVPWGRVDWSIHPGQKGDAHPDPHLHEFFYDTLQRRWNEAKEFVNFPWKGRGNPIR